MSSVLITLGFLAQVVSRLDPFVTALPALFVPWELTLAALVRNTIDNLVLLGQMQRIRGYNRALVLEADQFFDPPARRAVPAALGTVGLQSSRMQRLFTGGQQRQAGPPRMLLIAATRLARGLTPKGLAPPSSGGTAPC